MNDGFDVRTRLIDGFVKGKFGGGFVPPDDLPVALYANNIGGLQRALVYGRRGAKARC